MEEEKLSMDDYFRMNKTFSIWLIKKKKKKFEELDTSKA